MANKTIVTIPHYLFGIILVIISILFYYAYVSWNYLDTATDLNASIREQQQYNEVELQRMQSLLQLKNQQITNLNQQIMTLKKLNNQPQDVIHKRFTKHHQKTELLYQTKHNIPKFQEYFSEAKETLKYTQRPDYPALVLTGPPKCGTRTFVDTLSRYDDVIQYGPERDFWAGPNTWRCYPRYTKMEWMLFLRDYSINKANLSQLVVAIISDHENKFCYPERYRYHWNKIGYDSGIGEHWHNKTCHHPNTSMSIDDDNKYCYLIEKGPVYARAPWVPIVYGYLLPKIKLLTIIRNPVKQIFSAAFAFPQRGIQKNDMATAYKEIVKQILETESLINITRMCNNINVEWNNLQLNDSIDGSHIGRDRYLKMKAEYKDFILKYFFRRFVEPQDVLNRSPRQNIFIWSSLVFPMYITGLLVYDEIMGNDFMNNIWDPLSFNELNTFGVIQFEWMFSDIPNAMKTVKCWIMNIKSNEECDNLINKKENDKLFEHIEIRNHAAPDVNETNYIEKQRTLYEKYIEILYNPCDIALQHIVRQDRPQLLLGGWEKYHYKYAKSNGILQSLGIHNHYKL